MKPNKFIVIEGIDGDGKSTVGKKVAEKLNATLLETPPNPLRIVRDKVDRDFSPAAHYYFYLSATLHTSCLVREILKTSDVVCVRYILTTLIYHKVRGVDVPLDPTVFDILQPDHTFLLTVSEQERSERMYRRGMTEGDKVIANEGVFDAIRALYYQRDDVIQVRNERRTPEETAEAIISSIS